MNQTIKILVIVLAVLGIAGILLGAGFFIGRAAWGWNSYQPGGMMGFFNQDNPDSRFGYGMMGPGMMGRGSYNPSDRSDFSYRHGMMGGNFGPGFHGPGMMGGFSTSTNADPLSAEESLGAVEAYLANLGNDDLAVKEIMVFDNNSYAIIVEESTGIGAFELLIDPATQAVFPEYGPNMMWNLKYGMHAGENFGGNGMMGSGMMGRGGMMGGYGFNFDGELPDVAAEMTVSEEEAFEYAQDYLDTYQPGVTVSHEITAFYGYYTIDLEKDGEIVGMLSVNGFNGQVFPHTWHGTFIEMIEEGHE